MARKSFLERNATPCTDVTYQDVAIARISPTLLRCVQRIAVDTGTTKATVVQFGLKHGDQVFWLGSEVQGANSAIAAFDGTVYAPGDFVPFARVVGGTSGQTLALTVCAYTSDQGI